MSGEPYPQDPSGPDPEELAAEVNLRLAQLDWPVVAGVETDVEDREVLVLRRVSSDMSGDAPTHRIRVGSATMARSDVVQAVLDELRARGWDHGTPRSAARSDVLWCAPA